MYLNSIQMQSSIKSIVFKQKKLYSLRIQLLLLSEMITQSQNRIGHIFRYAMHILQ